MAGEFGIVLRKFRRDAKLTLQELSDATGFTASRICRYEMGEYLPSSDTLVKLARGLKVEHSLLAELANRVKKEYRLGKKIEPPRLLEYLKKIDGDPNYRSSGLSLNELQQKLGITKANQPDTIRQIRTKYGLTMTEFARRSGISLSQVSRLESGERRCLSRRAMMYLYVLESAEKCESDGNSQNRVMLSDQSLDTKHVNLDAPSPHIVPVFDSLSNRIVKDYVFIQRKYTDVWGINLAGIIASNYLCYKDTIKRGDLLIVSLDKKPTAGDLCIITIRGKEYITAGCDAKDTDCVTILQVIRTISNV